MIRLAVRVRREHAEIVLAELLELAPGGVEEIERDSGATVEFAIYGAPGELPQLPDLDAAAGAALVEVSTSEIADDWHERWRRFHHAVVVEPPHGSGLPALRIRPPWEALEPHAGERLEIAIDPGQAFGTGAHATTRLCLELLLELAHAEAGAALARPPLIDVGTGSGVLAIAAALLGFSPVLAIDNERESVTAAAENALVNGARVETLLLDLRAQPLPWPHAEDPAGGSPVVVANLLRPLLIELAAKLPRAPAHLIAGGLLRDEADAVAAAFARRLGLRELARRCSGEWASVWLAGPR